MVLRCFIGCLLLNSLYSILTKYELNFKILCGSTRTQAHSKEIKLIVAIQFYHKTKSRLICCYATHFSLFPNLIKILPKISILPQSFHRKIIANVQSRKINNCSCIVVTCKFP